MDTPYTDTGAQPPATPAAGPAALAFPPQGGAWVRLPDGTLVREAHTRDPAEPAAHQE